MKGRKRSNFKDCAGKRRENGGEEDREGRGGREKEKRKRKDRNEREGREDTEYWYNTIC